MFDFSLIIRVLNDRHQFGFGYKARVDPSQSDGMIVPGAICVPATWPFPTYVADPAPTPDWLKSPSNSRAMEHGFNQNGLNFKSTLKPYLAR
jgi:hypothetical protein